MRRLYSLLAAIVVAIATAMTYPASASSATTLLATSYYVDCSAATNGNGSQAQPWNILHPVNLTTFATGDKILFKRGTTCTGTLAPEGSGSSGAPIVVDTYGTGTKPIIAGNGATTAVFLHNQQYWEIRNLDITNTGVGAATRRGVFIGLSNFGTANYFRLINLTIRNVNGNMAVRENGGIVLWVDGTSVASKFNDVIIDGNDIRSVDRSGVFMWSNWNCRAPLNCAGLLPHTPWTNIRIRNNTVSDTGGDGIVLAHTNQAIVENNVAHDINMRSAENNGGIWTIHSDGGIYQFNEVYGVRRAPGSNDGMAFDIDDGSSAITYQYNYSHDNEGGFLMFCGCGEYGISSGVVRYNVSQNDKSRIISAVGAQNAKVFNNTIYLGPGSTTKIVEELRASTFIAFSNNIFYNLGTGGYGYPTTSASHYTWTNNVFYGYHPANEPVDPNKITANPLFASPGGAGIGRSTATAYRLNAGSPAIGTGVVIANNGGRDFEGDAVSATLPPDIGAFES